MRLEPGRLLRLKVWSRGTTAAWATGAWSSPSWSWSPSAKSATKSLPPPSTPYVGSCSESTSSSVVISFSAATSSSWSPSASTAAGPKTAPSAAGVGSVVPAEGTGSDVLGASATVVRSVGAAATD
ncbi:hypothetical protein GCM10009710_00590 [Aeromicrobium alkaliterrae]|uniref:Secreted protein n=1 Tax=Aeromicrobium alkaliterrae TaxID=302168 RepID=A0ABP4VHF7_9ACTN